MRSRHARLLSGLALALVPWAGPARAQEYGATARVAREQLDAVQAQSALTRDAADRAAAGSVGDALAEAPAVTVQRTSSGSAAPIVRGMTGYQVLLTVDELRLNDSLTRPGGHALLSLIDPESVARIEVVRGPASVVHGSDALGGYVHVTTQRTPAAPGGATTAGGTLQLRAASAERALRGGAAVHGALGGGGLRLSASRGHAGALLRGGGLGEQPYTGHDDFTFSSRLEAAPSRAHRFSLAHQSGHLFDMPRSDTSAPDDYEITKNLDRESMVLAYRGRYPDQRIGVDAYAGLSLRREHRQRVLVAETRDERDRVLSWQAGASVDSVPWPLASLTLGAEAVLEDVASGRVTTAPGAPAERSRGRYLDGSRYDTYALYALLAQGLGQDLTLLAGTRATLVHARAPLDPAFAPEVAEQLRLDERVFGVVGSLGTRYQLAASWVWTASFLTGFRAPNLEDFQALGGGARGFVVPSPTLDEEHSYTLESGVEHQSELLTLGAYLFGSLLDGLIVRVPATYQGMTEVDGDPVQTRQNASEGFMLGAELSGTLRLETGWFAGLELWATWGEVSRVDDAGASVTEPASKVPPPAGALRLGLDPRGEPYWAEAVVRATLPQTRLSLSDKDDVRICADGPCTRVDGYAVATLRAGLRLDATLGLTLAVENLFDAAYKTFASGAYAPGRSFVASLRGTL